MELWIRSQDKRHLIKADFVSIMENNIINVVSSTWDYDVAKYKTKERALEILDEIEELDTNKKNIIVSGHFGNLIKITYEMPEK